VAKKRSARRARKKAEAAVSSERLHDVVIYLDPLNGRLWAEPKFLVLVRRDGPHRIKYWNRTSGDITIQYRDGKAVGGRKRVPVRRADQKDDATVVAPNHDRGVFKYGLISALIPRIPGVVAAGDPEIIVE
jgi:hypothetical protein